MKINDYISLERVLLPKMQIFIKLVQNRMHSIYLSELLTIFL